MLICGALETKSQFYFSEANHLEPQWRWEAGISFGLMNCLTDLGGGKGTGTKFIKDINWNSSHGCGGIYTSFTHLDKITIELAWNGGTISAADSILHKDRSEGRNRYLRNLHFKSRISEFSLILQFHPFFFRQIRNVPPLSPYLLAGAGIFKFNPRALLNDRWMDLQPLHTEGQGFREYGERKEYKLEQPCLVTGTGIKIEISARLMARFEFIYRILFTDYLDDISTQYIDPSVFSRYYSQFNALQAERLADRQGELILFHHTQPGAIRGNPANKDAYFSFNLKLGVIINRGRRN